MLCSIAFKKNHLTTISTIKISSLSELGGLIQNHKKQEIAKPVPSEAKESHPTPQKYRSRFWLPKNPGQTEPSFL